MFDSVTVENFMRVNAEVKIPQTTFFNLSNLVQIGRIVL